MSSSTLNFVLSKPNEAAARIEALENALREIAGWPSSCEEARNTARAALAKQWPQDAIDQEMIERTDDGWFHPPAEQDK